MSYNADRTGFNVSFYEGWKADLKNCLEGMKDCSPEEKKTDTGRSIAPILMPSKGRLKGNTANFTLLVDMGEGVDDLDELEDFSHLMYVVVEEQELQSYNRSLKDNRINKLVLVSIPGENT